MRITFSLAEQCFDATRSIGLLNLSIGMLESLCRRPEVERLTLFSNDSFKNLDLPEYVKVEIHNEANGRGLRRIIWDQYGVYRAALRAGNDWLFIPKGFVSFLRKCPLKLAAYVPDVIHSFYEQVYPGEFNWLECKYLQAMLRATLRQAKVIFTCSEFTSSELAALSKKWGINPPPLVAIGTGFEPREKYQGEKPNRLLVLVSPWKHKRTDLAIDYLKRWIDHSGFNGEIDLVGGLPKGMKLPEGKWILHRRVPENEYRKMMTRSRAVIIFSEYEGFGMPPVEAILSGACSVYSDIPASREVMAGMGAPFDNSSYESFAKAMDFALKISANQLDLWAKALLERHNWKKGAEKIVNAMLKAESQSIQIDQGQLKHTS
ncbi:MAG: glycosyltransferase [Verrucomicrobiia bacterium]